MFERRKSFPKQIEYTEYFIHRAMLKPYKQDHAMTSDKIFADFKIFSKDRTYLSISAF